MSRNNTIQCTIICTIGWFSVSERLMEWTAGRSLHIYSISNCTMYDRCYINSNDNGTATTKCRYKRNINGMHWNDANYCTIICKIGWFSDSERLMEWTASRSLHIYSISNCTMYDRCYINSNGN